MFTFVHVTGCVPYLNPYKTIYDLTFISEGGRDGGGVTDQKTGKPVTVVQNSVSTLSVNLGMTSSHVSGDKKRYFKPKHDVFLTLTK